MMLNDFGVSRETFDALHRLSDLVRAWTKTINLVSRQSVDDMWNRHILDSAQIFPEKLPEACHWVDIGSGGGFPGLVCATLAREASPNARFTLVESDARKAIFLRTAARELDLNVSVLANRIESLPSLNANIISARALASLDGLLGMTALHLKPDGRAIFLKGATALDEVAAARKNWHFEVSASPSKTNPDAKILIVEALSRV